MVLDIGPHVSRAGASAAEAIGAARDHAARCGFRMGAAAIFVGGPRTRTITLSDAGAAELRAALSANPLRVFAHSAYTAYPWRGDPDAARHIREERAVCAAAGIEGLVVHLPKLPRAAVVKYAPRLSAGAAVDAAVRIYFETPAIPPGHGEQQSAWASPNELARLWSELHGAAHEGPIEPKPYGLAIDTAHLWTSGVDLTSRAAAERWLASFDAEFAALAKQGIPMPPLLLHLNSSERPLGAGPDKHAPLGSGTIWRDSRAGLSAVLAWAAERSCPAILERNGETSAEDTEEDYSLLLRLAPGLRT